MNYEKIKNKIVDFIKTEIEATGTNKAVIGLSGGIDSSLVAYLTVEALGKENVIGVMLPINEKVEGPYDSALVANILGIKKEEVDITSIVTEYFDRISVSDFDRVNYGNFSARIRMCILYDKARTNNALVIGTTNKTEMLLGYFTKYGDGGVDLEPIADLYKTEVFELARYLGVPDNIINKAPSAGLWEGQTDEKELGVTYEKIDKILKLVITNDCDPSYVKILIEEKVLVQEDIAKVKLIMKQNKHKRFIPKYCNLGDCEIG